LTRRINARPLASDQPESLAQHGTDDPAFERMYGLDNGLDTFQVRTMTQATVRLLKDTPDQLFTNLDGRDAAVWLMPAFVAAAGPELTSLILRLPWSIALSESGDARLLAALETQDVALHEMPRFAKSLNFNCTKLEKAAWLNLTFAANVRQRWGVSGARPGIGGSGAGEQGTSDL
jgi:hypothetical protein